LQTSEDPIEALRRELAIPEARVRRGLSIAAELRKREREALALYEPLDWQRPFHLCRAPERILQAPNQYGKTLAAAVEVCRAITGQDPHRKYPLHDGVAFIVTYDEKLIGKNLHRYFFEPGAFRVIWDHKLDKWRAWRPWEPEDKAREEETKKAPPLLPARFVNYETDVTWGSKADKVFTRIHVPSTGWECYVFSSRAVPTAGFQADLCWFDEDIEDAQWYGESVMRLEIRKGLFVWSALPQESNNELVSCIDRAEEQAGTEKPTTVLYRPDTDNPYFDKDNRKHTAIRLKGSSEDVYRMRFLGERSSDTWKMYPTFDPKYTHDAIRDSEPRSEAQHILTECNGTPPNDWTRYMIVDPGHSVCAVGFFAVPPPQVGDTYVLYDELYIKNCSAAMLAQKVASKTMQWNFEAFIIDAHGARLTDFGSGLTPREQYEAEFQKLKIQSNQTGCGFIDGCDNIDGRVDKLRADLSIRPDGSTRFLVVAKIAEWFCIEMRRFKKKEDPKTGMPIDEGNRRTATHMIECAEYGAAHGLPYVQPKAYSGKTWAQIRFEQIKASRKRSALGSGQYQSGIILGAQGVVS